MTMVTFLKLVSTIETSRASCPHKVLTY